MAEQRTMTIPSLDDTDRQLLALLRDDARMPVVTLARKLRLARATVQNRLARLEREGTIVGYTVKLKPGAEVRRALAGHPNVVALHSTNGRWDLVAELRADSLEAFEKVLGAIRQTAGIANTETSILLATYKL